MVAGLAMRRMRSPAVGKRRAGDDLLALSGSLPAVCDLFITRRGDHSDDYNQLQIESNGTLPAFTGRVLRLWSASQPMAAIHTGVLLSSYSLESFAAREALWISSLKFFGSLHPLHDQQAPSLPLEYRLLSIDFSLTALLVGVQTLHSSQRLWCSEWLQATGCAIR